MSAKVVVNHLSPNHGSRRGTAIQCIVLHADASPDELATLRWCANPKSEVSYHVLIGRNGVRYRMVADDRRAWACGRRVWDGQADVNSLSLSLSFANRNDGQEWLTDAQIQAARAQVAEWRRMYPSIRDITTHKRIAPSRKSDPEQAPNFSLYIFQQELVHHA
jgi:N-acetylmuramoyl-L-alanine amidase